jgi:hypothetical protein
MRHAQGPILAIFVVSMELALVPALGLARADLWRLTVRGGEHNLGETPLVAEVKSAPDSGAYRLEPDSGNESILAQVFRSGDRRFVATILPRVAAHQTLGYRMKPVAAVELDQANGIRMLSQGASLAVELDHQALAGYRADTGNKPFWYPLVGPTGDSYTRGFPMLKLDGEDTDHPHQRSCWFTHGNVNGIDFWSEGKGAGTIRETGRTVVTEGPVLGRLETRDDWFDTDQRRICSDVRTVTFYRTIKSRIIDFDFTIEARDGPVEFRDTKEGMFGLRVASSMDAARKNGGKITNADGLTNEHAWGRPSSWVDYVGPVHGRTVGIAILNHPDSLRYPTSWHVRPYGLFAANPFGWHDFGAAEKGDYTVPNGQKINFHYRVILHEGSTDSAGLISLFDAYARPPAIELAPG